MQVADVTVSDRYFVYATRRASFLSRSEGCPFLTRSQSTGNVLDPLAVVRRLLYAAETPREVQCGRDSSCPILPFLPFLRGSTNL